MLNKMNKKMAAALVTAIMTMTAATPAMAMPSDVNGTDAGDIYAVQDYYTALGEYNVHSGPSTAYPVIGVTETGKEYYIFDCEGGYYTIDMGDEMGYIITGAMSADGTSASSDAGNTAGKNTMNQGLSGTTTTTYAMEDLDLVMEATIGVNVRQEPSTDSTIIGGLKQHQQVVVTGALSDSDWYQVSYAGTTGYVYDDYLMPEMPQTMKATIQVNMREEATTNSAIIKTLAVGDIIKASELTDNGWYKFSIDGVIGYAYGEYFCVVQ